jgi:hypothetical protein
MFTASFCRQSAFRPQDILQIYYARWINVHTFPKEGSCLIPVPTLYGTAVTVFTNVVVVPSLQRLVRHVEFTLLQRTGYCVHYFP